MSLRVIKYKEVEVLCGWNRYWQEFYFGDNCIISLEKLKNKINPLIIIPPTLFADLEKDKLENSADHVIYTYTTDPLPHYKIKKEVGIYYCKNIT